MPEHDDHIQIPVEWVVIANNVQGGVLQLSLPLYLQQWLITFVPENYLIEAKDKPYDEILEGGIWEYQNPA